MLPRPGIGPEDVAVVADFVRERCGIDLDASKGYLIEGRWNDLLRESACSTYVQLCGRAAKDPVLAERLIDTISTKETSFFRDRSPFDLLRQKLLPTMLEADGRDLRIWSAACATGQEVYSLAMVVADLLQPAAARRIRILGTDLSDTALAAAREARFNRLEVARGLDEDQLHRHFTRTGQSWQASDELRGMVSFDRVNLLDVPPGLGRFDVIFCRNVATYFAPAYRRRLFDTIAAYLAPRGVLVLGSTESLLGISDRFHRCQDEGCVYYRLVPTNGAAGSGS